MGLPRRAPRTPSRALLSPGSPLHATCASACIAVARMPSERPMPRSTPGCRRSGQWSGSAGALLPSLHRALGGRGQAPRSRRRGTRPFLRVGERRRPAPTSPIRRSSHTPSDVRTARRRERVRRAMTSGWAISRTQEPRRTTGLDEENGACSARGHPRRRVVARRRSLSRGTPRPVPRGRRATPRPFACRG